MEDKRLRVMTMYVDTAKDLNITTGREYPVHCIMGLEFDAAFEIRNDNDEFVWIGTNRCVTNVEFDIEAYINNENEFKGELY
ncbi:MAG: hypothetical protein ACRCX8_19450 [Sarcina sp.]